MASRRLSILPWRAWLLRSYGCDSRACTHKQALPLRDKAMSALLSHRRRAKAYPIRVTTGKAQAEQCFSALASIVDMKEVWRHLQWAKSDAPPATLAIGTLPFARPSSGSSRRLRWLGLKRPTRRVMSKPMAGDVDASRDPHAISQLL